MSQNRNKLISLFIGNLANAVTHRILGKAIDDKNISLSYESEIKNSFDLALKYREKINPVNVPLPLKDIIAIKNKVNQKVTAELRKRDRIGYKNIDFLIIDKTIEEILDKSKIK